MKKILFSAVAFATVMMGFVSCSGSKEAEGETINLKWATFNIRYDNPEDSMNNWQYRKDAFAKFIIDQDIDVVGMQEVLHNQLVDIQERLTDYTYVGVGREDGKEKGEYAPIFFKKDRFDVLDSNTFWLSQYPDSVGFVGWDGACERIATWAKLQDKATGKVFMAVNTHFDHVGHEARRQSALLIIDKIKEIVGDQPAVLTGDFNVDDRSEAYQTITTNEFVLKDSHKIAEKVTGVNYTFHDFGQAPEKYRGIIDFVFVTPQITVHESFIQKEGEGYDVPYLSDHNPKVVTLEF